MKKRWYVCVLYPKYKEYIKCIDKSWDRKARAQAYADKMNKIHLNWHYKIW